MPDGPEMLAGLRLAVIQKKFSSLLAELGEMLSLQPDQVEEIVRKLVELRPDFEDVEWVGEFRTRCHDCGVPAGYTHRDGCDLERCTVCGGQRLQCSCEGHDKRRAFWTGMWPGAEACMELGWYSKMIPGRTGWHRCSPDDPDGSPDMNRWTEFVMGEKGRARHA